MPKKALWAVYMAGTMLGRGKAVKGDGKSESCAEARTAHATNAVIDPIQLHVYPAFQGSEFPR